MIFHPLYQTKPICKPIVSVVSGGGGALPSDAWEQSIIGQAKKKLYPSVSGEFGGSRHSDSVGGFGSQFVVFADGRGGGLV